MTYLNRASQLQAWTNFFKMMNTETGFFRLPTVRTLCEVYQVDWYNTDLDRLLKPFDTVDIVDISEDIRMIIKESVSMHINVNQG